MRKGVVLALLGTSGKTGFLRRGKHGEQRQPSLPLVNWEDAGDPHTPTVT